MIVIVFPTATHYATRQWNNIFKSFKKRKIKVFQEKKIAKLPHEGF